jgi:ADP-ribose pyrophosphatase YjhB (NUDIX family)
LEKNDPVSTVETFVIKADVASVAVMDGSKILMGKRNDNNKYTLPGGHLNGGEKPVDGAKREVKEEAGLEITEPKHLGHKTVDTVDGKKKIHAYVVNHDGSKPSTKNDPDKEVKKWEWIETRDGMPKYVIDNLHSKKNVVLNKLGLQKSFFISDIFKARTHKYIRKYKRGDKWMYVYHEAENHGVPISEEHINHLKALAKQGHPEAKQLTDNIEAHDESVLTSLRALADNNHPEAIERLKHLGINRKQERKEEALIPAQLGKDTADKPLSEQEKNKAVEAFEAMMVKAANHLQQHKDTPIGRAMSGIISGDAGFGPARAELTNKVKSSKNLRELIQNFHEAAKKLEEMQGSHTSQNSDVTRAGGTYGNMIYHGAMNKLVSSNVIPQSYADVHKREAKATDLKVVGMREHEAVIERQRQEQEERDRRELAEVHGSMAHYMSTISDRSMEPAKVKELHSTFKSIFGKDLRKEDFPYDFSAHGLKTRIKRCWTPMETK